MQLHVSSWAGQATDQPRDSRDSLADSGSESLALSLPTGRQNLWPLGGCQRLSEAAPLAVAAGSRPPVGQENLNMEGGHESQ